MNEETFGREPVEVIEIITPKCTNTFGTAPCTASAAAGGQCFNTRETCQDTDNFQARPLAHLTPDVLKEDGDTVTSSEVDRDAKTSFLAAVTFPASPTGTIWEQGGTGDGAYLGITGDDLVFRAFDGSVATGSEVAKITSPISNFAGRTLTLIGEIDPFGGTVALWEFDPVELVLTKIGEDTITLTAPTLTVTGASSDTTTTIDGVEYRVVTWTSSGSLEVADGNLGAVEYLLVGGGGAGGGTLANGGGGGGGAGDVVVSASPTLLSPATYTVTVGAGGTGVFQDDGNNGSDTSAFSETAIGGGGGGANDNNGLSGGSGGGGGTGASAEGTGGPGTGDNGNDGGDGDGVGTTERLGGGGGGAGAAGANGVSGSSAGDGGDGYSSDITGSTTVYAGGGGGGAGNTDGVGDEGAGGSGGGGGGSSDNGTPTAGTDGLGGGGGGYGGNGSSGTGADGGDGVVIARWPTSVETSGARQWAGTDDGAIGNDSGTFTTGEDGGDFNGTIDSFNFFDATLASDVLDQSTDAYRQRYMFDDGRKAKPFDDVYILPLLKSANAQGTRINLAGADERFEPLGRRAYMSASFADAPHSDFPYDPYVETRVYDPLERGTFWTKWLIRNKYGKTRAIAKRYTGYDGQKLSDMRTQTYVLDSVQWNGDGADIEFRDVLSLTEFRRAQVPAPSPGKLDAALTAGATTAYLTGDVTASYPASGTLRINDELMTYTGRSYDSGDDQTDFTGLTRGTDGSTADAHDVDDGVQLCRRYTAARIDDVFEELLVTDSAVPAQLVNLSKFTSEYDDYLSDYTLTTVISEPTGVNVLIGEVAEQCALYIWWNERDQVVDMQAIRALVGVNRQLTQERHIIEGSFKIEERPKERLTTISFYYNPRDFAGDLGKPTNFENNLIVSNSEASGEDLYGKLPQTREIFSRWLTTQAEINQTGSRYSIRYVDVPSYATLMVDAKDRALWAGDFVTLSHDALVDQFGNRRASKRWLIIEAEEVEAGHMQRLVCADVTLDGLVYVIGPNTLGTYNEDDFNAGYGFITDNSGLNPDGTDGATIS